MTDLYGTQKLDELWDRLIGLGVSDQTILIVTSINGYRLETLTDILFAHTGYRTFDQLEETE